MSFIKKAIQKVKSVVAPKTTTTAPTPTKSVSVAPSPIQQASSGASSQFINTIQQPQQTTSSTGNVGGSSSSQGMSVAQNIPSAKQVAEAQAQGINPATLTAEPTPQFSGNVGATQQAGSGGILSGFKEGYNKIANLPLWDNIKNQGDRYDPENVMANMGNQPLTDTAMDLLMTGAINNPVGAGLGTANRGITGQKFAQGQIDLAQREAFKAEILAKKAEMLRSSWNLYKTKSVRTGFNLAETGTGVSMADNSASGLYQTKLVGTSNEFSTIQAQLTHGFKNRGSKEGVDAVDEVLQAAQKSGEIFKNTKTSKSFARGLVAKGFSLGAIGIIGAVVGTKSMEAWGSGVEANQGLGMIIREAEAIGATDIAEEARTMQEEINNPSLLDFVTSFIPILSTVKVGKQSLAVADMMGDVGRATSDYWKQKTKDELESEAEKRTYFENLRNQDLMRENDIIMLRQQYADDREQAEQKTREYWDNVREERKRELEEQNKIWLERDQRREELNKIEREYWEELAERKKKEEKSKLNFGLL